MITAITSYFNPRGYKSHEQNYAEFAAGLRKQGVSLLTAELAFDDRPFTLDATLQLRTTSVLWHKERLLNLLLPFVETEYVAWIDADVLFRNNNWPQMAIERLQEFPVVQLFDKGMWTTNGKTGRHFAVWHRGAA